MGCALWWVAGCAAAPLSGEKGGLVAVKVDEEQLAKAYAPRRFALLIGISEVADGSWRTLRYSRKDAEDLADALRDPRRGNFGRVSVLDAPEQTTRAGVMAALAALRREATRADDVVVVYVSAHGTLSRDAKGELKRYLVTRDAQLAHIPQTALSIDELKGAFDSLPSRRRLLVLATCHSGSGKSLLPKELEEELSGIKSGFYARPIEEASRASMVFSACDWGETAREDEKLQNDIYTHFFIEGLTGSADRNVDGAVTATEAHDYARRRTFAFTSGRQRPSAEILEVGADPVVLSGSVQRLGRPELFSYAARLDGFTLKVDGEEKVELPGGVAVEPGRRKVELTKGSELFLSSDVNVGVGERLDLEELVEKKRPSRSVSLVGGGFGFLDAKSRDELLPLAMGLGLSLRFDGWLLPRLGLAIDLMASSGSQSLKLSETNVVPFTYRSLDVGVSFPYRWQFRQLSLFAGPRVAALWLQRSFQLDAYQGAQSYLTVSPGAVVGAALLLTERLELSAQANITYTWVVVDGSGTGVGFAGGWAGLGYRF